jgi:hypothetical protein
MHSLTGLSNSKTVGHLFELVCLLKSLDFRSLDRLQRAIAGLGPSPCSGFPTRASSIIQMFDSSSRFVNQNL